LSANRISNAPRHRRHQRHILDHDEEQAVGPPIRRTTPDDARRLVAFVYPEAVKAGLEVIAAGKGRS